MNEWNSSPRPRRKKLRAVASSSWNNPSTRCHNDVLILLLPLLITKLIIINPAARLAHYVSYSPWGLPSQGRECASALRPSRGSRRQTARIRRCGTLVYLVAQSETRVCVPRHWLVTSTLCTPIDKCSNASKIWTHQLLVEIGLPLLQNLSLHLDPLVRLKELNGFTDEEDLLRQRHRDVAWHPLRPQTIFLRPRVKVGGVLGTQQLRTLYQQRESTFANASWIKLSLEINTEDLCRRRRKRRRSHCRLIAWMGDGVIRHYEKFIVGIEEAPLKDPSEELLVQDFVPFVE